MPLLTAINAESWYERPGQPGGILSLVPFTPSDMGLAETWLGAPHVAKWWCPGQGDYEARIAHERAELIAAMEEPGTAPFLIRLDGERVGYLQLTHANAEADLARFPLPAETIGIDLLIGRAALIGKGFGRRAIRVACEAAFSDPRVAAALADPHPRNAASIAAFRVAGFVADRTCITPSGPALFMLLRRS